MRVLKGHPAKLRAVVYSPKLWDVESLSGLAASPSARTACRRPSLEKSKVAIWDVGVAEGCLFCLFWSAAILRSFVFLSEGGREQDRTKKLRSIAALQNRQK